MAANVVDLMFTDPIPATVSAAAELRARGADAVIVIAHMGGRCSDMSNPNDAKSCAPNQEANDFLNALPAGTIDAYFAGHTHSQMRHYINGVPAAQGSPFSREFSTIDLWVDPAANKVVKSEIRPQTMICAFVYEGTELCDPRTAPKGAALVPRVYDGKTIVADARVSRTIEPYLRRVAAKRDEKVGITTSAPFTRTFTGESPLGVLISDALREYAVSDIAMFNSGGIRAELPAKELTYAEVFAISPFDNYPAVVKMTGREILETLRLTSAGLRGLMQVSGLRYTLDATKDNDKPVDQRNKVVSVTLADGSPLDLDKTYTVVMPDFIAAGGDGTQAVMSKIPRDRISISYARPIRDALVQVLSKKPQPLAPKVEGRITVLNLPK
jgi:5'-nucleotidase